MPKLSYMPFYPADWLLDTQDLSDSAYRAYHRLLCNMWLNRSISLPNDPAILRNRAGVTPQKWPHIWREIEGFFEVNDQGQVYHQKLSRLGVKARSSYEARSGAGRKGGAAKSLKVKLATASNAAIKSEGKRTSNQNQTIINNREISIFDLGDGLQIGQQTIDAINEGKRFLLAHISPEVARRAVDSGLVSEEKCKEMGVI